MRRELNVVVSGRSASGKTTVARVIADTLAALGVDVDVLPEADGDDTKELAARRLPGILSDGIKVTVSTRQERVGPPAVTSFPEIHGSQPAPATQQAGDVVAYLDVGASGYLDLGSELSEDALQQLPKGRHALVIAGTYGIDGYVAAPQPSPTTKPAPQQEAQAKHALLEASHALDAHSIRVHRKRDGLLMVNARGKSRFMTLRERIAYWLLGNTTDIRP